MKTKKFVICRTYSAGVFAGYLDFQKGKHVKLSKAIRIWYWKGAASLSQLAAEGPKFPDECRFGIPVTVELTEVIEIIYVTQIAKLSIQAVPVWKE